MGYLGYLIWRLSSESGGHQSINHAFFPKQSRKGKSNVPPPCPSSTFFSVEKALTTLISANPASFICFSISSFLIPCLSTSSHLNFAWNLHASGPKSW